MPNTPKEVQPIHGDRILSLIVGNVDGRRKLANPRHAGELVLWSRIHSSIDDDHPGVGAIDLYNAVGPDYTVLSLEEAMEKRRTPQRFLVSMTASGIAIVSSRIGYKKSGPVGLLPPSRYSEFRDETISTKMYDYRRETDDQTMMGRHTDRLQSNGGDPSIAIPQSAIDRAFRYMDACTYET